MGKNTKIYWEVLWAQKNIENLKNIKFIDNLHQIHKSLEAHDRLPLGRNVDVVRLEILPQMGLESYPSFGLGWQFRCLKLGFLGMKSLSF